MRIFLACLRWDIVLQLRSHFYTATVLATAVICLLIWLMPLSPVPAKLATLLVFMDPAFIGLVFVGAFILMEKGAGTLQAIAVTPLPGWIYLGSKLVSFTLLGLLCGITIWLIATRGTHSLPLVAIGLTLSNAVATLIGISIISRAKSVNAFLANILIASIVLTLPLLPFLDLIPGSIGVVLKLIPSYAMLSVVESSMLDNTALAELTLCIAYLLVWIIVGWFWCLREYRLHMVTEGR